MSDFLPPGYYWELGPIQISRLDLVDFISNRMCENLSRLVEQFRADALLFHARVAAYMDSGQRTADSVQNFALSTIWKMMVEHVLSEVAVMSAAKLPAKFRETPVAHNERMALADAIKHSHSLLTELKTLCVPSVNEHKPPEASQPLSPLSASLAS